jgi:hypothetical protein
MNKKVNVNVSNLSGRELLATTKENGSLIMWPQGHVSRKWPTKSSHK